MNKQIEEMAKVMMEHCEIDNQCGSCHWSTCNECLAEYLYNAGYRKQSVWISVDERLPDRLGKYLVFTLDERMYLCDFIDFYCDGDAQFDDYRVTHWMPLPEAPKRKE